MKQFILALLILGSGALRAASPCGEAREELVKVNGPGFAASVRASGMSASATRDSSGRIEGAEILFPHGDHAALKLKEGVDYTRKDWTGFASLSLDLENTSATVLIVGVNIMSKADSRADGERAAVYARMAPGRATLRIPLRQLRYTNGWSWPLQPGFFRIGGWGRVESSGIAMLEISVDRLAEDVPVVIRGITLAGRVPPRQWVDRFGQDICGTWDGKVASDMDITSADLREGLVLASATAFAGRDSWGGWVDGPQRKAGKYFRVEKFGGRWWFVAPSGRPWLAAGMDCVLPGINARMDRRISEAYSWLPPESGEFAGAWKDGEGDAPEMRWPSFYRVNLVRKWGADSFQAKWRERAIARTRAWGFTCFGNWSDESLFSAGIPYFSTGPDTWAVKGPYVTPDIADAFFPGFEREAEKAAKGLEKYRGDPWLVGHFVGNEMNWADFPRKLLEGADYLPARSAFLMKLRKRYRKVEALNGAWGTSATSFEVLRWPGWRKANEAAKRDMGDFLLVFADRFMRGWAQAIRKADPGHLVLGTRLHQGSRPDEVVRATAKYMDVVTFNHYSCSLDRAEFDRLQAIANKPFLIGEYGFNSLDTGLLTTAVPVRNRAERGAGYRYYTEQLAAIPYFVGGHYFQYLDEPITGRFDRETSYNGFVNVADIPFQDLVDAAVETNSRIYRIHGGTAVPTMVPPQE